MENTINKYTYRIEWSEEDGAYICRCLEFPSLVAHGDTQDQALNELKSVVKESIEWLKEDGDPIPEPLGLRKYKGNLTLRVSSRSHCLLATRAAEEGVSINQFITSIIESNIITSKSLEIVNAIKDLKQEIDTLKSYIINQYNWQVKDESVSTEYQPKAIIDPAIAQSFRNVNFIAIMDKMDQYWNEVNNIAEFWQHDKDKQTSSIVVKAGCKT